MAAQFDPEGNEIQALFSFSESFLGKNVLEIGCGDGRLTWHYAHQARRVTGIDPQPERIAKAIQAIRPELEDRVIFLANDLLQFAGSIQARQSKGTFDLAILSWSL